MMSVEQMCCVVTVSEIMCNEKQQQPTVTPLSCSGVVINYQSGLVLCSGLLFSRFLLDKDCKRQNPNVLSAYKFSNQIQVFIDHVDVKVNQCTSKRFLTNECPTCRKPAELLMMINCVEFQVAFQKLFSDSEQWKFTDLDEDDEILYDSNFLSWFAVLRMTTDTQVDADAVPWIKSTALAKGCSVLACGSPFGSFCPDLFMSTLSKGIVSNLAGEDNALILTDARCLPGTQGGGLFVSDGDSPYLVGLITSPLCWKSNEWIGLTLVCSLHLIIKNISQAVTHHQSMREITIHSITDSSHAPAPQNSENGKYPVVVVVESGQVWGSGIVLSPNLVLTCRHVVNGRQFLKVTFNTNQRAQTVSSTVLYSTKETSPYDVAFVQLQESFPHVIVPQITTVFLPGEDVLVLGYGGLGKTCGPSLTSGILSRVVQLQNKPVMLQTTCAVNCGASGGAVVRAKTGELLGIVASNTRDFAAKVTYPHLNFSIPVSVLEPLLRRFAQTQDPAVFQELDSVDQEVRRVWRLQIPQSKL